MKQLKQKDFYSSLLKRWWQVGLKPTMQSSKLSHFKFSQWSLVEQQTTQIQWLNTITIVCSSWICSVDRAWWSTLILLPTAIALSPDGCGASTAGVWNHTQDWSLTHLMVNTGCHLEPHEAVVGNTDVQLLQVAAWLPPSMVAGCLGASRRNKKCNLSTKIFPTWT